MPSLDDPRRLLAEAAEHHRMARTLIERAVAVRERALAIISELTHVLAGAQQERQRAARPREKYERRCPHCASTQFETTGGIRAEKGLFKISGRCGSCGKPYIFVNLRR